MQDKIYAYNKVWSKMGIRAIQIDTLHFSKFGKNASLLNFKNETLKKNRIC